MSITTDYLRFATYSFDRGSPRLQVVGKGMFWEPSISARGVASEG